MRVTICDKCKRPIPRKNNYKTGDIRQIELTLFAVEQRQFLDICSDCSRKIRDFLKDNLNM